jgi:hypothetical protein
MLIRAYLVSGEFRVHRADCRDCTREARRSDSSGAPEEFPSKAAVIRSLWADIIAEAPAPTAPRTARPAWKPALSSCPAPAGCRMSDPPAGGPAGGSGGPASQGPAASGPRGDGDGIAVDIRHAGRAGHGAVHRARERAGLPGSRGFHLPGPPVHRQRVPVRPRLARQLRPRAVRAPGGRPGRAERRRRDSRHSRGRVRGLRPRSPGSRRASTAPAWTMGRCSAASPEPVPNTRCASCWPSFTPAERWTTLA